jgi:hypothetical protein
MGCRSCADLPKNGIAEVDSFGKPPALPRDSKSLTAPYFETLRNAEKALTNVTDLFGEGRRAKAEEALPMEFSAAVLWQTPGFLQLFMARRRLPA